MNRHARPRGRHPRSPRKPPPHIAARKLARRERRSSDAEQEWVERALTSGDAGARPVADEPRLPV